MLIEIVSPLKPPIADHPLFPQLVPWFRLTVGKAGNHRFNFEAAMPLELWVPSLTIHTLCMCGQMIQAIRTNGDSEALVLSFTGRGHVECAAHPVVRRWAVWLSTYLGHPLPEGVAVQPDMFEEFEEGMKP
jgi:hypothetical protein